MTFRDRIEVGFAGAELAFPSDGLGPAGDFSDLTLVDGHARKDLAGSELVPVLVTDLTAAEALKVLATFDPLGAAAEVDVAKLDELLQSVEFTSPDVAALLAALAEENGIVPPDFQPTSIDEQGKLDEKSPITCPHCKKDFVPE